MVELHGISFAYPGQGQLLDGVSLRFPENKITAILGPNGILREWKNVCYNRNIT